MFSEVSNLINSSAPNMISFPFTTNVGCTLDTFTLALALFPKYLLSPR